MLRGSRNHAKSIFFHTTPKTTHKEALSVHHPSTVYVLAALDRRGVLTRDGLDKLTPEAILDALTLGTRAAAITVSRPGADPPWAHELAALPA